jgi:hypothetical protein
MMMFLDMRLFLFLLYKSHIHQHFSRCSHSLGTPYFFLSLHPPKHHRSHRHASDRVPRASAPGLATKKRFLEHLAKCIVTNMHTARGASAPQLRFTHVCCLRD